jgi:hypothetical protein
MNFKLNCGLVIVLCLAESIACADTLELKNGSRIEGKFVGSTDSEINFQVASSVQKYNLADIVSIKFDSEGAAGELPTRPESSLLSERRMGEHCKRATNAPVQAAMFVLKSRNAGRRKENGTSATNASGNPAAGGGVCGQWHAAKRILPQSRFGLEHAGSSSEEEKKEKQPGGWPGRGGIGHPEVAGRARAELWAGRGVGERTPDRSAA